MTNETPIPARIPEAHTLLIDRAEYEKRRADEIESALHSRAIFGSWAAYAQSLLDGLVVYENDAGRQWGTLHHQLAIAAAGLAEEIAETPYAD